MPSEGKGASAGYGGGDTLNGASERRNEEEDKFILCREGTLQSKALGEEIIRSTD